MDHEPQPEVEPGAPETPELEAVTGRVKWFDATRGFGFLVCDGLEGDVLLHFSVLREHGRRSVPEGAIIECIPSCTGPDRPPRYPPITSGAHHWGKIAKTMMMESP